MGIGGRVRAAEALALAGLHPRDVPHTRVQGELGRIRGEQAEARVVSLLQQADLVPPWILGARRAAPAEDRRGVDVLVQTDVGILRVQVKCSHRKAKDFARRLRRRRRAGTIGIVVVPPEIGDEDARERVILALAAMRRGQER